MEVVQIALSVICLRVAPCSLVWRYQKDIEEPGAQGDESCKNKTIFKLVKTQIPVSTA